MPEDKGKLEDQRDLVLDAIEDMEKVIVELRKERTDLERTVAVTAGTLRNTEKEEDLLRKKLEILLKQETGLQEKKDAEERRLEQLDKKLRNIEEIERKMQL